MSQLLHSAAEKFRVQRLSSRVHNREVAQLLYTLGLSTEDVAEGPSPDSLRLTKLDLELNVRDDAWFLPGYSDARSAVRQAGARFTRSEGRIYCDVAGVRIHVQTSEELLIIREVFCDYTYDFRIHGNPVVLDVGMNVGIASLRMAAETGATVIGFEPFPDTCRQIEANLQLNPELAKRISYRPYGLAGDDAEIDVEYVPEFRASCGVFATPPLGYDRSHLKTQRIRLRRAVDALDEIMTAHPGRPIVAKIDCEGSEYEIFRSLEETGRLRDLSLIMLEWHRRAPEHDPEALLSRLTEAGFCILVRESMSGTHGIVQAVRGTAG